MNNYKKVLPMAVAMALAACGGGSDTVPDQSEGSTRIGTYPRFDPLTSDLPLNTDLVFAKASSSDGTADVGTPTNPVEAGINVLDGFSPSAYFDIAFAGGSIDESTVYGFGSSPTPNVFLIPLDTGSNDALDPNNVINVDSANIPMFSVSVESLDGGTDNVLRVIPEEPLLAKSKYLVFVTNGIKDAAGQPITPSSAYQVLGEDQPTLTPALVPVRTAVQGWENIASGFLAQSSGGTVTLEQARDSVVVSYTFTTTDPIAPLVAMGAPRAALLQTLTKKITEQLIEADPSLNPAEAQTQAQTQAATIVGSLSGGLSTPEARDLDVSAATGVDFATLTQGQLTGGGTLYTGYIKLPYYLTAPAVPTDYSFLQKSWTGDDDLGLALGGAPQDIDGSYNVTYRYPFAKQTGIETVPLQVTLPDSTQTPAELAGASCENIRDSSGYPVVIYVHGITSDRSSVVALAHSLASKCVATVAIDLPVHGVPANSDFAGVLNVDHGQLIPFSTIYGADAPNERHFDVIQDVSGNPAPMNFSNPSALDGSGSWFINLASLANTRDNLRESVMDLMNLNASLGDISGLDIDDNGTFDLSKVKVIGVSLGGIVGTVFASANQQAIAAEGQAGFASNLNPLTGLLVSSGGSQVTQILNNSPTFAPRIQAGLAASGVNPGTSDYEKFLYVAQSMVASGDPVNFAQPLVSPALAGASLDMPILVQQIVGGGDTSGLGESTVPLPDQVVPNGVAGAPLAGATPLAKLLGADQVGPGAVDTTAANALVNLTIGQHASLLSPYSGASNGLATAELQTEAVSFVLAPTTVAVGSAPAGSNAAAPFIQVPPTP